MDYLDNHLDISVDAVLHLGLYCWVWSQADGCFFACVRQKEEQNRGDVCGGFGNKAFDGETSSCVCVCVYVHRSKMKGEGITGRSSVCVCVCVCWLTPRGMGLPGNDLRADGWSAQLHNPGRKLLMKAPHWKMHLYVWVCLCICVCGQLREKE